MVTAALALMLTVAGAPSGRAEFERASRLYAQQRYENALPWFEKAVRRSGRRPSVLFGLAQCERRLGMLDEAETHLLEFLEKSPESKRSRGRMLLAKVRAEKARIAAAALGTPRARARSEGDPGASRRRPPPPAVTVAPKPPPPAGTRPPWVPPPAEVEARTEAPPEDDSILSSPVFWIVTGVVAAAGAVTAGVLLTRGGSEPYGGTSGQVFEP